MKQDIWRTKEILEIKKNDSKMKNSLMREGDTGEAEVKYYGLNQLLLNYLIFFRFYKNI